jgi:hypothetical protein
MSIGYWPGESSGDNIGDIILNIETNILSIRTETGLKQMSVWDNTYKKPIQCYGCGSVLINNKCKYCGN